jgi:aspartate racemase
MAESKHIGIAAVTAEGAALCYRTICVEAPAILGPYCHPQITMHTYPLSEYMRCIEADRWEDAGRLLLSSGRTLAHAGAEVLICPDNTLHQALDRVRSESPTPWLHIAEEVAAVATARGFTCLGILGTRYLMEGPVYASRLSSHGIEHKIPGATERAHIDAIIFGELVNGHFEDRARQYFRETIRTLGAQGCDAVVLGCTEIPLLISDDDSSLPALDSTRILARAALREATRDVSSAPARR